MGPKLLHQDWINTSRCGATSVGQTPPNRPIVMAAFSSNAGTWIFGLINNGIKRSNKAGTNGAMSSSI